jgi:hypothetical protein
MNIQQLLMTTVFFVPLAGLGCADAGGNTTKGVDADLPLSPAAKMDAHRLRSKTLDDSLLDVARAVPSFGGMFFDESGRLHVRLLDLSAIADAEKVIAEVFGPEIIPEQGVVAAPAEYSFAALKALHERVTPTVLSVKGTVLTDVDDADNRVKIGVEDPAARERVEKELARLGIARQMLEIVEIAPILPAHLQGGWRPVTGGLQIETPGKYCTLGFSAIRGGTLGIVGNSHCTQIQGGVENTAVYQPTASSLIGTETVDPVYSNGGSCPVGRVCRDSDSAFFETSAAIYPLIAMTPGAWILSISAWLEVPSKVAYPVQGQVVQKTGRTSGTTSGTIQWACATINSGGGPHTYYCNYIATNSSQNGAGGDSGSPVYFVSGGNARITGIMWGADTNPWSFAFSPIGGIENDLGVRPYCQGFVGC